MTLQRYHIAHDGSHVSCICCSDSCVFKHENGAWIKASEHEAEIAAWKQLSAQHEIEIAALKKRVQELEAFIQRFTSIAPVKNWVQYPEEKLKVEKDCNNCKHIAKSFYETPCDVCDGTDDKWEPQQ